MIDDIKNEMKRVQMDNNYKIITFSKTGDSLYDDFVYLYHNSLFQEPSIRTELMSLTSSTPKDIRIELLNKIIINGVSGHLKNESQEYIQFIDDVKLYDNLSIYTKTILELFREALVNRKLLNKKSKGLIYKLFTMCREYHVVHIENYDKYKSSNNQNDIELNKLHCIINQNIYKMEQLKSNIETLRIKNNKESKRQIKELETNWSQLNQTNNNHTKQISILEESIKKLIPKIEKELAILNFYNIDPKLEGIDIYEFLNSYDDYTLSKLLNKCLEELVSNNKFFVEPLTPSMKYIDFFKSIRYYNCFINVYDCKHSIPNFNLSFNPEYSLKDGFKSGIIDYTGINLSDLVFKDESKGKQRDPHYLKVLFGLNKLDYLKDKVGKINKPADFKDITLNMQSLINEIKNNRTFQFISGSTFILTACNVIRMSGGPKLIKDQIKLARQLSLETNTMTDITRKYINSEELFRKKYLMYDESESFHPSLEKDFISLYQKYKNKYLQLKNKL
jgi:hypothetical protein